MYEERRLESLQIMDGLKNKCEKIQGVITGMEVQCAAQHAVQETDPLRKCRMLVVSDASIDETLTRVGVGSLNWVGSVPLAQKKIRTSGADWAESRPGPHRHNPE